MKALGSILDHACLTSRLEFSFFFTETLINSGYDQFERSLTEGTPHPKILVLYRRQSNLHLKIRGGGDLSKNIQKTDAGRI